MNDRVHELVLASAGTGKTYRLALRYLDLLLRGVAPERILATTFTRKAAGEIQGRVLLRLAEALLDAKQLAKLQEALPHHAITGARAKELLVRLVRDPQRMRISTIDAFFASVAGAYALDLGLPPGWRIVDDETNDELIGQAIADTIARSSRSEILSLLVDLQRNAAARAVHATLLRTVTDGLEHYRESSADAWNMIVAPPPPDPAALDAAIAVVVGWPCPQTKAKPTKDNSFWRTELDRLPELLREGNWKECFSKGIPEKVALGEASFQRVDIAPELAAALHVVLDQAVHELVGALVKENHAAREFLGRFDATLTGLRNERGALRFEDLPRAITAHGSNPLSERGLEMAWRLDGRIDHLLLDEFQDTSPAQWRFLDLIADDILATSTGERTFFCVGDVKQSIYGWRGGEPELLATLHEEKPVLAPPTNLHKSFRSSQVVLDVVNRVFDDLANNAVFSAEKDGRRAGASVFESRFVPHEAATELPGAALLLEAGAPDKEQGEEAEEKLVQLAIERIATLHAEEPRATIGVLLRRRKWAPRLILGLAKRGLRASGEGGNPLTDSSAVLELLSLLHLADHPEDDAAAFHVARAPLFAVLKALHPAPVASEGSGSRASGAAAEDTAGTSATKGDLLALRMELREARRIALAARRSISARGYGQWLFHVHAALSKCDSYGDWDLRRTGQLVELGLAFDQAPTTRTGEFVRHARRTRVEDESAGQIKIMTVHASKGLEFDAVILLDLHKSMLERPANYVWKREGAAGPVTAITRTLAKEYMRNQSQLQELDDFSDQRRIEGELSVLYVALTRAKHRLELLVPAPSAKRETTTSFAWIVRHAFGDPHTGTPFGSATLLWSHASNAEGWLPPPKADERAPTPRPRRAPLRFVTSTRSRNLATRSASAEEVGMHPTAESLLRPAVVSARTHGTLVHRFLEEVEWLDLRPPSDDHLRSLALAIESSSSAIDSALAEFHAALARPSIQELLTRPKTNDELVVWRERRFALRLPDERGTPELWQGAFDRVVLTRRAGRFVSAQLIDWKSDDVRGDELESRSAAYRLQLEAYRRVLCAMTGLDHAAVGVVLVFLRTGELR